MTGKTVKMLQTRQKVFRIVRKCSKRSQDVSKCPIISENVHFRHIVVRMDLFSSRSIFSSFLRSSCKPRASSNLGFRHLFIFSISVFLGSCYQYPPIRPSFLSRLLQKSPCTYHQVAGLFPGLVTIIIFRVFSSHLFRIRSQTSRLLKFGFFYHLYPSSITGHPVRTSTSLGSVQI